MSKVFPFECSKLDPHLQVAQKNCLEFIFDNMLGICHRIQTTSLQKQGQFVEKEDFISTNMVHNGAPNVGARFNGYFLQL
jgi:hypothetical protein